MGSVMSKLRRKRRREKVAASTHNTASTAQVPAPRPSLQPGTNPENLVVSDAANVTTVTTPVPAAAANAAASSSPPGTNPIPGTGVTATTIVLTPTPAVGATASRPFLQPGTNPETQNPVVSGAADATAPAPAVNATASSSPPETNSETTQLPTPGVGITTNTIAPTPAPAACAAASSSPSTLGTNSGTTNTGTASLWEQALDQVRANGQGHLDDKEDRGIMLVRRIIDEISQKKNACDEKRWFYINKRGEKVFFVETFLGQLNKYALIGDLAIQHHPDIVALVWAGFRLLLQVGTAYTDSMRAVSESLDSLMRILCCCDIYEKLYCGRKLGIAGVLNASLVNLYASILGYLCYARQYLQKGTDARILESFFSGSGQFLKKVWGNEKEVERIVGIAEKEVTHIYQEEIRGRLERDSERAKNLKDDREEKKKNLKIEVEEEEKLRKDQEGREEKFRRHQAKRRNAFLNNQSGTDQDEGRKFERDREERKEEFERDQEDRKKRLERDQEDRRKRLERDQEDRRKKLEGGQEEKAMMLEVDQRRKTMELDRLLVKIRDPIQNIEEIYAIVKSERRSKILEWLSDVKFSDHHSFYSGRRQSDTGHWLLENEKFLRWRHSESSSILWLRGDAGSGKTILASFVIDEFQDQAKSNEHVLAYFYCNYKQPGRRNPASVLRALVKQFCLKNPGNPGLFPTLVLSTYEKREQDGHSSGSLIPKESKDLIVNLSEKYLQTTIVIDALDECDRSTRRELFSALYNIAVSTSRVRIFLTSRYDKDIEDMFTDFPSHYLDARDNSKDINTYINAEIERRCGHQQRFGPEKLLLNGNVDLALKSKIISTLQSKANGMFMWAHLQILALCEERTPGDVEKALDKLPKDLDTAYSQILERIDSQSLTSSNTAKIVLRWLLYAQEPCSTECVVQALTVIPGGEALDEDRLNWTLPDILSICQSLVVYDKKLQNLRFAHFSVQEFLQRHHEFGEERRNHTHMAEVCLTTLSYHHSKTRSCLIPDLLHYSVSYWGAHTRLSGTVSSTLQTLCRGFLRPSPAYREWGSKAMSRDHNLLCLRDGVVPPLWTAFYYRLYGISTFLAENGEDLNARNGDGRTPLSWVAGNCHENMVQLLLEKDRVDVNSKDKYSRTPLSWAAGGGHENVVQLLLEKDGVDVNLKDEDSRTPLSWAAGNCYEKVVQLLLEKDGVDVDSKDWRGQTPLCWAAGNGCEKVVQLLLKKDGVDVNSKNKGSRTPLSLAAGNGCEKVVQLLLGKNGVDAGSKDEGSRTPLSWAAGNGHEKVVQLLLEKEGVHVDSKDWRGQTPLSWAARSGRWGVVQLLLKKDRVDVNSKDRDNRTPLSWAVEGGCSRVVQLLLDKDEVDVHSKDRWDWEPLSYAAASSDKIISQMLGKSVFGTSSKGQSIIFPFS